MSAIMATSTAKKYYGEQSSLIEYLGVHNNQYCFGVIDKIEMNTVDQPFYVLIDDDDVVREIPMPVIADDAYEESQFATIERKYHFFETNAILEDDSIA